MEILGYNITWLIVLAAFVLGGLVMERIMLKEREEEMSVRNHARKRS